MTKYTASLCLQYQGLYTATSLLTYPPVLNNDWSEVLKSVQNTIYHTVKKISATSPYSIEASQVFMQY